MLVIRNRTHPCTGPVSRRRFLQAGSLALGGLSLPDVLAGRAASGNTGKDTSVILLFLSGGPSQLETYDLKPDIPRSYRGIYGPIATNVPGITICDRFPLQAKLADKFSLVRSLHHNMDSHSDGSITVLTGRSPQKPDPTSRSKSKHPDFGSVASKVRGMSRHAIPPYVAVPHQLRMTRPGYLGLHHRAFDVGDPSAKNYSPPQWANVSRQSGDTLRNRRPLLEQLDRFHDGEGQRDSLQGTDDFRDLAYRLLTSSKTGRAFDISREDDKLRDRYGRNQWGQGCLMARRLAEAGTSVVTLYLDRLKHLPYIVSNWDDHPGADGRPGHYAQYLSVRMPYLDQCLSALIEDVFDRGLDKRIMVVAVGEFGRTPRISAYDGKDRSGSLAAGLLGADFRWRTEDGPGGRCHELESRVPHRAAVHAAAPAGDHLPPPRDRHRDDPPGFRRSSDRNPG
ncbi:MAG: hypothetical protein Ct9H300mP1_29590 [Planctomycetaceae bacterium]|nr:MAG: hypothetical protein Ct9H300mP1_29590 [Planctomycetaceae bacterium]